MTADPRAVALVTEAARAADRRKGLAIRAIDVSSRLPLADAFLLVTGNSERQVGAIVDEVEQAMAKVGQPLRRREGHEVGRWVLLDYDEAIIHIQHHEDRAFYGLDSLWKDCPAIVLPAFPGEDGDELARTA
ncbi:MAG: ribosome silencing factor [Micrococcales bacterium]|nr:ribosome silencing factor [Micrococcales bacterium]